MKIVGVIFTDDIDVYRLKQGEKSHFRFRESIGFVPNGLKVASVV